MRKETGGSAFPRKGGELYQGMTLRDYFAAHAPECPKEWLSRYSVEKGWHGEAKARADWCFEYADEMMKARDE